MVYTKKSDQVADKQHNAPFSTSVDEGGGHIGWRTWGRPGSSDFRTWKILTSGGISNLMNSENPSSKVWWNVARKHVLGSAVSRPPRSHCRAAQRTHGLNRAATLWGCETNRTCTTKLGLLVKCITLLAIFYLILFHIFLHRMGV